MRGIDCTSASVYGWRIAREQRRRGRPLDDAAGVHDADVVGAPGDDAEVVGDEDHRHVRARCSIVGQQVEDLLLDRDVERGGGLVGDEQLGPARQRHGDHDALAHAARQLVRVLAQAPAGLRDADLLRAARAPGSWPSRSLTLMW